MEWNEQMRDLRMSSCDGVISSVNPCRSRRREDRRPHLRLHNVRASVQSVKLIDVDNRNFGATLGLDVCA